MEIPQLQLIDKFGSCASRYAATFDGSGGCVHDGAMNRIPSAWPWALQHITAVRRPTETEKYDAPRRRNAPSPEERPGILAEPSPCPLWHGRQERRMREFERKVGAEQLTTEAERGRRRRRPKSSSSRSSGVRIQRCGRAVSSALLGSSVATCSFGSLWLLWRLCPTCPSLVARGVQDYGIFWVLFA